MTSQKEQQLLEEYRKHVYDNRLHIEDISDSFQWFISRMKEQEEELVKKCAEIARNEKRDVLDLYPNAQTSKPTLELAIQVENKNRFNEVFEQIALQIESLLGKE